jgi:ribosomal protein L37E
MSAPPNMTKEGGLKMYNDKMIRCPRCGNEVPAIPTPEEKCRECGYDPVDEARIRALDAALDFLTPRCGGRGWKDSRVWQNK